MITEFDHAFPWLQSSWVQLVNYITQDRIPQALLLTGQQGLGKQQLAEFFAHTLLCTTAQHPETYCGKCQSCLLFKATTHPDYILIEADEPGKAIGIAVIRQLIAKLELKPQFAGYRVVVINPADSLNNAAANAFLKYLEEPTERTILILITHAISKLPATMISRCQKLHLPVPDEVISTEWLKQQGILDNHALLLSLSQGSPLSAKHFADHNFVNLRNECFAHWHKLSQPDGDFIALAEQWHKLERTEMDLLFFWLISWVVDMIKLFYQQQPIKLFNPDLYSSLQDLTQKLDLRELYQYYDFLLISQQNLDKQLNKQLMIEEILIHWLKLNSR